MAIYGLLKVSSTDTYPRMNVSAQMEDLPKSFYDTDGLAGYSYNIVPDILHLVRYNQAELDFIDVVGFRSMYLNHRPEKIYVHCSPCGFEGNYTRWLEGINFTFIPAVFPTEVFGIPIMLPHHATDVLRLRALMRYGGYYLDRDVFVVQSLRRFLRYEATISCASNAALGNNLIFFHKNSRFLRLYLDTYRKLNDSVWYYNAGMLPTEAILEPRPHLVHRMYYGLETELDMLDVLYEPHAYPYWRNAFAIHFLSHYRMQSPYDPLHAAPLNESNIRDYDNAFGQMARSVLFGTSDFVSPDAPVLSVAELAARKDRGEDLTSMRSGNVRPFFHPVINSTE
ncbi:uncharacterized protein LOC125940581 [Dermacentor silvarum]|uniref:uncharacterized protein LOC125940581 n=1 Tax=Dermacentor silvarum TaxID=543639 RepID=UPI0021009E77|nr:uncharacterized protein LOC125940581 [Dermacentor silvarum]